ncbi:uncharacterized protein [Nothobranchius furzeri]|nr:uncharacterized protein LOC107388105 [Nothobranchius furzeri]
MPATPAMTEIQNIIQIVFPVLVIVVASILLCFYLLLKKKREQCDTNRSMQVQAISPSGYRVEEDTHFDPFPPRYSIVVCPPPYAMFDPKLTNVWPGGPPPPYEMYPITLPLAPHWMTPAEPLQLTRPASPQQNPPPTPQRYHRASVG